MVILLTGATGCLGRALVPEFISAGHRVIVLVRPGSKFSDGGGCEVLEMDLRIPLEAKRLPSHCDAVVHVAQSREYHKLQGALDIFRVNTAATVELANYGAEVGAREFFLASTGSLYEPSPMPIPETGPITASNFYSASKLAAEQLLAPFAAVMTITIGRLFYLYGPGQHGKLLNDLAKRLKMNSAIDLQGEGGPLLTPTFSGDVAKLTRRAIEERWSGVYNMASSQVVTLQELAEEMGRVLGLVPMFVRNGSDAPIPVLPDLTKLKDRLIGLDFTTLKEGLDLTLLQVEQGGTGI